MKRQPWLRRRSAGSGVAVLKAISDAADFSLPTIDGFVAATAGFDRRNLRVTWRCARGCGTTMALARNSSKASRAFAARLQVTRSSGFGSECSGR